MTTTATFRANVTVLRQLENGSRWIFLGRTVQKGVKMYKVQRVGDAGEQTRTLAVTELAAESALTAEQLGELDALSARLAEQAAERSAAYRAQRALDSLCEELNREAEDRVWERAVPVFEPDHGNRVLGEHDLSVRVRLVGPKHRTTRRNTDEVVEYDNDLSVTIYVSKSSWYLQDSSWKAEVNWSAIGSSTPAVTRAYARLMVAASYRAEKLAEQANAYVAPVAAS